MTKTKHWFTINLPGQDRKKEIAALGVKAAAFVRGGGTYSVEEWDAFTEDAKSALIVAQEDMWTERIVKIGYALRMPEAVMAELDGGEMLQHSLLKGAVEKAANKYQKGTK